MPSQELPAKRTAAARVLSLLGAFSQGGGSLTLSEISRYAELSLTTSHRLVQEVLAWGGIEADGTGRYRLGVKILDLASSSTQGLWMRENALPHLADLHRRTGSTVHLAARDGDSVMYLEALRAHPNYTGENRIGGRLCLHVTATGLAILAHAPERDIAAYVAKEPLKRYTPRTMTDPEVITEYLEKIRRDRYALVVGSLTPKAGSIAAPVFNPDGSVDTAVGVVYLADQGDPQPYIDLVRVTAARISRSLREPRRTPDPRTVDFNRRHAGLA